MSDKAARENPKLVRVGALCLALPGATRRLMATHADFRVRKTAFCYYLDDHHGDGVVSVCVRTLDAEHVDRARRSPERFYLPMYLATQGWVGIYLDRGRVPWREIEQLIEASYRQVAPKVLLRELDQRARLAT